MQIFTQDGSDIHEILRDLRAGKLPTLNELVMIEQWLPFAGGALPSDGKERFQAALRRLHSGKPLCFYDHQLLDELLAVWDRRTALADKLKADAGTFVSQLSRRKKEEPWG